MGRLGSCFSEIDYQPPDGSSVERAISPLVAPEQINASTGALQHTGIVHNDVASLFCLARQ
jgi:hypothetical protein